MIRIRDFFFIPDPISDPQHRILSIFNPKTDIKLLKIRSGMFISDPGTWIWITFFYHGSWIRITEKIQHL